MDNRQGLDFGCVMTSFSQESYATGYKSGLNDLTHKIHLFEIDNGRMPSYLEIFEMSENLKKGLN